MLQMQVSGKRRRGRPKRKFMDGIKEDLKVARVTIDDAGADQNGKKRSAVATPNWEKSKEEEESSSAGIVFVQIWRQKIY